MTIYVKIGSFIILLGILMEFCGKIEGATVTCEPKYVFLPCTSETWGILFLIVVYQYLIALGQKYISDGSDKFFSLIGPGIFGASLFHILANFPTLFLVLQSGLSNDKEGSSASSGMDMLTGSAVMSLTITWPSVIIFGSYDLTTHDDFITKDEPSFLTKLTAYGVTTDKETSYTARIMLVSVTPFIILQLPAIISSISVTRVIILVALIVVLSMYITYIVYQIFQPWIQNRRFAYVTRTFVKRNLQTLLSTNGKPNVPLIREIYKGIDEDHGGKVSNAELKTFLRGIQLQADSPTNNDFVENIMDQFDISGNESIEEDEFVRILTKWLQEASKSLSRNDYNPLTFFFNPNQDADKEQQKALIPKKKRKAQSSILDFLRALSLIFFGIVITLLISSSFIANVVTFATRANVPPFLIPYFIIPCATNISRFLSTIRFATQKTERAASLTFSKIYSGVSMSSMSTLTTFLLLVYIRDLPWDVSAQAFVVLLIGGGMAVFTSTRTTYPLWMGYMIYLIYPISLLMLYLLTIVWG
ncbi:hypothetical protein L2E82_39966 [Cichorium intybus]|uniref:Uncharacterized protein n=1 Tax=Cichorium intybus TaxID=13427 RepID=A0ACB9AJ61_CICIN|nr:hypothetical protein L2E82_39966 [Cichorium intybus]